jgi:LCP family protein required for cell wall assembly
MTSPGPVPGQRRRSPLVRTLMALMSVLVLGLTGLGWYEYRLVRGNGSDALSNAPRSTDGDMNVLLIGLDSRKDQNGDPLPPQVLDRLHAGDGTDGGYNTNTLILMHIPADGHKAVAFSIPRDDFVNIPGEHPDKIKKAYGFAKARATDQLWRQGIQDRHQMETLGREAGRKATLDLVRSLTGVPIDHFAEVNLAGFYDAATALGQVQVCLNAPVHDDNSGANFPAGRQWLNGEQALSFVRQRQNLRNGDLDRTHRQQAFLAGVSAQLHSAGTLADPVKLQRLLETARQDVVVDSNWDLLGFAQQVQGLTGRNMQFNTLPIDGFDHVGNEDVNLIDQDKIRDIVRSTFGVRPAPTPAPNSVVDVLNASGTPSLASQVAQQLGAAGITTSNPTTAASPQSTSQVLHNPDSGATAQKVADELGGLPVQQDSSLPSGHVQVLVGSDYPASSAPASTSPQAAPLTAPRSQAGPEGTPVAGDIPCVD